MKQIAQATATIWKNVQRGAQIGILGTALVAGSVMGCANPSGGNTNTYEEDNSNTNTGNNSGNTNNGNTNTGNNGNTNTGNNNGNTNDNTGNSGNTGTVTPEPEPEPSKQYGTPYDKTIGNGNYVLHNFISDDEYFYDQDTIVEDMNHYLALGETYINDQTTTFAKTVNGRTDYFDNFINQVRNNNNLEIDDFNIGENNIDRTANQITFASESIYTDIINNMNSKSDARAFSYAYRIMANEAYKEGLGNYRQYESVAMKIYSDEKADIDSSAVLNDNFIALGFTAGMEYDSAFLTQVTNLSDRLLRDAVQNMNNAGKNVTVQDIQKVMNITFNAHSIHGMDARTKGNLQHGCNMGLSDVWAMQEAIRQYQTLSVQYQGLSM